MARILITSALPYINGVKHLGNLAGSMLPPTYIARFMRLSGHDVYGDLRDGRTWHARRTGRGRPPGRTCGLIVTSSTRSSEIHRRSFALSWDYFGRTSSKQNARTDPALRPSSGSKGLIEPSRRRSKSTPSMTAASCRTAMSRAPARPAGLKSTRRPVRQLRAPARPGRPDRSVFGGFRQPEHRDPRHEPSLPLQGQMQDRIREWVKTQGRPVAEPRCLHCQQMAG
jgi:methionyl-tRNA synthetase